MLPVTLAAAVWVMVPPDTVTVRFPAVISPRAISSASLIVTFVPLAVTVAKSFVLLERLMLPVATRFAVPVIVRLPEGSVMLPTVISARFAKLGPLVMALVMKISPVVLLPMVSRLAVMLPISVDVRPKFPADFVPRSTMVPDVGTRSTEPEEVALIVLVIVTFWAVIRTVPLPVMLSRVRALVSVMVRFVPQAVTVPKSFVLLPSVMLPAVPEPDETKFAVPLIVRLPAPVCVIELTEISVRFVPKVALFRLMAAVLTIAPVLLLPMVSTLAVIWLSSVWDRPRLADVSVPLPRFTPDPSVWISTLPAVVASTVPSRFRLLAVRVIRPPLE